MATVYLAQDLRHDRLVALKVLLPDVASAFGPERFLQEIRLTARLDHPHILALLDSGEVDGLLYYVMPFVEGESLRDRLRREKQLSVEDSVRIGQQVASALDYAHQHGIVHRDIKPENILLVGDHARVADFGIARTATALGTEPLTQAGIAIGTPAYMSPEQATGSDDVDGRTDIYSLGCLIYEMLVGEAPFTGATPAAIIARKLQTSVPSIRTVRVTVPPAIDAAVSKALSVVPADRYATALQFVQALGAATDSTASQAPDLVERQAHTKRIIGRAAAAILVVIAIISGLRWIRASDAGASGISSLAVLPLDNLTGDSAQSYFVDGMHEALTAELAQISALKVISRTSVMQYRGASKSATDIGRELGVTGLIEGSVARDGDHVRVTVQLIHAPSDRHLWVRAFDRELRGILDLHTEVARTIAREIKTSLTPQERIRLDAVRPVNPRAFELYLLGRHQWNQRTLPRAKEAVENYRKALEHDSAYAVAHAALGDAYLWLAEQGGITQQDGCALAAAEARTAMRLDDALAESRVAMAMWRLNCEWNWREAEAELRQALELSPGSAWVHQYYGRALSRVTNRYDEGLRELQQARDLDPLSPTIRVYVSQNYFFTRQYDAAGAHLRDALALNPDHALVLHSLGELSLAQENWKEAVTFLEQSIARPGAQSSHYLAMLGIGYARANRRADAVNVLSRLDERVAQDLVSAFDMAALQLALGAKDQALVWLERGYERKDYWLPELKAWPWFDSLKGELRYQDLLRKMKLPW
jgi:serine/threonine-protein kinase